MKQWVLRLWNWLDSMRPMPIEIPTMEFTATESEDGALGIKLNDLKVWIYRGTNHWVAQGLDIGYAASGETLEDVKKNFERGLFGTLAVNWKIHRNIEPVMRPAHPIVWIKWRRWVRENYKKTKFDRSNDSDGDLFNNSEFHPVFMSA